MVLDFGVFPENKAHVDENGLMSVEDSASIDKITDVLNKTNDVLNKTNDVLLKAYQNLARNCVVTGNLDDGSIGEMVDLDGTTYCGTNKAGGYTNYITFDLSKIYTDITLQTYYSVHAAGAVTSCTATIQSSTDGTTWTDLDSVTRSGAGVEVFKNHSELITARYVRMKIVVVYGGAQGNGARMYEINISQIL